jgi:hypothetical protein
MLKRQSVLIALILANSSIGFTQTLADFAREERARRNVFVATPRANPPAQPDIPATKLEASTPKPDVPAPKSDASTTTPAVSTPKPAVSEALITEAVRISGARRQLRDAIETFRPSLAVEKRPNDVSAQEYQQIVNEALGLDRLTQVMEQSVSEAVNDKTLTNIVRWYASSLGKKVATAEGNVYSPDMSARYMHYAATLPAKAPTGNRQELIESIGAAGLGIPRPPVDFDNDTWLSFVYDSLTEPELSSYLAFLNSPSATAFNNAIWIGIDAAFGDAAQHFQQRLVEKKR